MGMNVDALRKLCLDRTLDEFRAYVSPERATSVRVITSSGTDDTYPRCVADEFTTGYLTITAIDDGSVLRVYKPWEWAEGRTFDARGYSLYTFLNAPAVRQEGAA